MTANSLIDFTLEEIARDYQPGVLPWAKANRRGEWDKMLTLERRINEIALGCNHEDLRGVLDEYRSLTLAMVKEFIALKEKGKDRMNRNEV